MLEGPGRGVSPAATTLPRSVFPLFGQPDALGKSVFVDIISSAPVTSKSPFYNKESGFGRHLHVAYLYGFIV